MPEQAPYSSIPVAPNLLHYFVPIPLGLAEHLQGDHSDGDRFEVVSAPPRGRTCSTQV